MWSKVKAKATLERKTMREAIFEGIKWNVTADAPAGSDKKKVKKERLKE